MEKTAEKLKVNESLLKTVLCSATFWGLLAHGMVLFNKYSFHDDVRYFNEVGATYESGRWMLGILGSLSANLLGSKNYSLPVVNGTITILCIAAIVYLLADSLRIQSKPLVILLCGSGFYCRICQFPKKMVSFVGMKKTEGRKQRWERFWSLPRSPLWQGTLRRFCRQSRREKAVSSGSAMWFPGRSGIW